MQGFMILAIIGTEKDTLVFYITQIVDGRTKRRKVERNHIFWKKRGSAYPTHILFY